MLHVSTSVSITTTTSNSLVRCGCPHNHSLLQTTSAAAVRRSENGSSHAVLTWPPSAEFTHPTIEFPVSSLYYESQRLRPDCPGARLWNYMNDSFRSMVFIKYQPETIACACIFLAARQLQIPLPNSPPWYTIFNTVYEEIVDTCVAILRLYTRPKPNVDHLEKVVNEAKKLHVEAKLKAKGLASEGATPNSRPVSPGMGGKASPASILGIPAIKKIKAEDGGSDSSTGGGGGRHGEYNHSRHGGRKRSRSRSNSKSRSFHSSSGSRSGSRTPSNRRHTSSKKHKKESAYYTNNSSSKDKYGDRYQDNKHSGSDSRYADKYADRYYDKHDKYSTSSSAGKYDPKYDAYNYRDYKDKETLSHGTSNKDYRDSTISSSSKDHKHSSSKHNRDVSYSPNPGRGDRAWSRSPPPERTSRNSHKKSGYKDKHHSPRSRSPRSPVAHSDRHRGSKKHNGRSKDRYSSRR